MQDFVWQTKPWKHHVYKGGDRQGGGTEIIHHSILPIFTGVPTYLAQVYLQESPRTSIPTTAIHSPPHHRQRAQQRRCAVSMAIGIPRHKLDLGVFEHKKHLLALQSPSSHKITRPLLPSPSRSEFAVVWASVGAFGNIPHQSRRSQGGSICLSFFHGKRGRH